LAIRERQPHRPREFALGNPGKLPGDLLVGLVVDSAAGQPPPVLHPDAAEAAIAVEDEQRRWHKEKTLVAQEKSRKVWRARSKLRYIIVEPKISECATSHSPGFSDDSCVTACSRNTCLFAPFCQPD